MKSLICIVAYLFPFAVFAGAYEQANVALDAQNYAKAAGYYQQAADQGHAQAQYRLGVLYQKGLGVAKSKSRAALLFRMAADQDVAQAQYSLAFLYFYGQGVLQSREFAVNWLKKSAALGNYDARVKLQQFGIQ